MIAIIDGIKSDSTGRDVGFSTNLLNRVLISHVGAAMVHTVTGADVATVVSLLALCSRPVWFKNAVWQFWDEEVSFNRIRMCNGHTHDSNQEAPTHLLDR